jgi:hypothetical protein
MSSNIHTGAGDLHVAALAAATAPAAAYTRCGNFAAATAACVAPNTPAAQGTTESVGASCCCDCGYLLLLLHVLLLSADATC